MKKNYLLNLNKNSTIFNKIEALLFISFFILIFNNSANAQGTSCVTATPITINGACATGTIADTTLDPPATSGACAGAFSREGWYSFTVSGGPLNVIITAISTNRQLFLQLISSTSACTGLAEYACANANTTAGPQTETITSSLPNGIYYLKVVNQTANDMTLTSLCVTTPPSNDNCASAIPLTVATTCTYTTYTNAGATATSGVTAPGCASYLGGDVWFSAVVPSTGILNVDTQAGVMTDSGMAFYSGTCAGLTLLECDDDDSANGLMSYISRVGLTPGQTIFIRVWEFGNDNNGTFGICATTSIPITNDNCAGAIPLTVATTCTYATYSNSGATATTGVTDPGCAGYLGGDVWFSAVVPATGVLNVDTQIGAMTDSGMAFYSGTCAGVTLLECDDDDSANGFMSYISMVGLTPGQTIFIRVWGFFGGSGTFGICATTPTCPPPSDLFANILSTTSVTVNWANTTPPASSGYQYFITTTNSPPIASSIPTGTTLPGVNGVTLTGLTTGQIYYFWVRSNCGGTDRSTWFGPTNYTPCVLGSGSGVTTLACPSVVSGGVGLSGADPAPMSCQSLTCTNLEATYLQLNQPTNYTVASIPYAPPYQFTCLQNPVSVNIDDRWSQIINLPFNFCYYGTNYNRCLVGSNGLITFDTTTNIPGGFSTFIINNNLPNTALFRNTIFGVYHDIDPSLGGQVGWELITLNSGCRALVASWNDIPMFSSTCNSQLYTGMIVLYENTNVIDVYIRQKNVCPTWNAGNAIVGIQNAAGTAAVVAPNRNGLSPDWTVTNEAWRFTPTGTSLTSIRWFQGNGTSGPQIGTTDVINVCPTTTTTYTAEVTYALCSGTNLRYTDNVVVAIDGNKIWNGSQNSNWNVNNNWTPSGVPTSANCVVIPPTVNNPIISAAPNGVGYNLSVNNAARLTINSNQNLTITDIVRVQPTGIFTINNSASLIQINNIINSGNITYRRISPNIRTLDYVYWSSPVANFNVNSILLPFSPGPIYIWNTTVANSNGGQGNWQWAAWSTMVVGKGYIVRAPGEAPFNNTTLNPLRGTFTGVPNNGNLSIPIERGSDQNTALHYGTNGVQITNFSDNWNLIGNPYPSALRGSQFLFDNRTKIEGNIRLWTHGNLPIFATNPFYSSFVYNYTANDYLTYNFTGTSCCPTASDDLFIGAGQGFFVLMSDGPQVLAASNVTVDFNNNQRNASFDNSIFYRQSNPTISSDTIDINNMQRNRVWLDVINATGQSDRTLFGYISGATMGVDHFFDCFTNVSTGMLIFTETADDRFLIQGRSLPFDVNDEVTVGINIPTQGLYSIAIAGIDGLFNSQNIYLKDNLLNSIHDLKVSPYQFTSDAGVITNRFKIVYVTNALSTTNPNEINTFAMISNNMLSIESSEMLKGISIYEISGKLITTYSLKEYKKQFSDPFNYPNGVYIAKITLENDMIVSKKLIK